MLLFHNFDCNGVNCSRCHSPNHKVTEWTQYCVKRQLAHVKYAQVLFKTQTLISDDDLHFFISLSGFYLFLRAHHPYWLPYFTLSHSPTHSLHPLPWRDDLPDRGSSPLFVDPFNFIIINKTIKIPIGLLPALISNSNHMSRMCRHKNTASAFCGNVLP